MSESHNDLMIDLDLPRVSLEFEDPPVNRTLQELH